MNRLANLKFWQPQESDATAGIVISDSGISLALLNHRGAEKPQLTTCQWRTHNRDQVTDNQLLATMVRDNLVGNTRCVTTLSPGSYQIFLVDRPNIPEQELKTAIRWQVKDLIDYPIEEANVDLFTTAPMGAASEQKLYVVVVRTAELLIKANLLQNAGLNLDVIDIPELGLRNIAARLELAEQGLVMLHLEANNGVIVLIRGETLYLARGIDLGNEQLFAARQQPELLERFVADIALEIQRSTNYYDMQFRQPQLTQLISTPLPFDAPDFFTSLATESGLVSRELTISEIVNVETEISRQVAANAILALGSALRVDSA